MPPFYLDHFRSLLSPRDFLLLQLVVRQLDSRLSLKLESLATALPYPIQANSRLRKLQRWLLLPVWVASSLWLPLVYLWWQQIYPPGTPILLALDRTQWQDVNLLCLSWVYRKRAIPLLWLTLSGDGASNLEQQCQLLSKFIPPSDYTFIVLGDREFCSVQLAQWLEQHGLGFVLRLKRNTYFRQKDGILQQLSSLDNATGVRTFIGGVKVTKTQELGDFNLALYRRQAYRNRRSKDCWFLMTSCGQWSEAVDYYKQRMCIEEMFRDCKEGGYRLEKSRLRGQRLESLILVMSIAYGAATYQGEKQAKQGIEKYASCGQSKTKGKRHSTVYSGRAGRVWAESGDQEREIVQSLLRLSPGKRPFYARGQRAQELMCAGF